MLLYKSDISYFSGKVEAYLHLKGIPHEVRDTGYFGFLEIERATGVKKMPAIALADGRWLYDSTWLIRWLEGEHPSPPVRIEDPVQGVRGLSHRGLWRRVAVAPGDVVEVGAPSGAATGRPADRAGVLRSVLQWHDRSLVRPAAATRVAVSRRSHTADRRVGPAAVPRRARHLEPGAGQPALFARPASDVGGLWLHGLDVPPLRLRRRTVRGDAT